MDQPAEGIVIEKHSGFFFSRLCAVMNSVLLSVLQAALIFSIVENALSQLEQSSFDVVGIRPNDALGYFECGWNGFQAHVEENDELYTCDLRSWNYGYEQCVQFLSGVENCEGFKVPKASGIVWFVCCIAGSALLSFGMLAHALTICSEKAVTKLHKHSRLYKLLCCVTVSSALFMTLGVVYWINTNNENGCLADTYDYIVDAKQVDKQESSKYEGYYYYQYSEAHIGVSLMTNIAVLGVLCVLVVVYCIASLRCCQTFCPPPSGRSNENNGVEMQNEGMKRKFYNELDDE